MKIFISYLSNKYFLIFLACLLSFLPIFIVAGGVTYVDMAFPLTMHSFSINIFSLWANNGNYNNIGNLSRSFLLLPLYLIVNLLHLSTSNILTKVIFFVPFLISVTFSYLLVELVFKINSSKVNIPALLCSILSCINPWVVNHAWTYYIWLGYSAAIACIYFILKGYVKKKFVYLLYASPFLILTTAAPHTILIFLLCAGITFIYFLFYSNRLFTFQYYFLLAMLFFFLNIFWILLYLVTIKVSGGFAPEYILTPGLLGVLSNNNYILNLFSLIGGWNEQSVSSLIQENILNVFLFTLPLIFATSLFRRDFNKLLLLFYILSFVGIAFAAGPIIMPTFYYYITFNSFISGLIGWAFRSPDRWLSLYSLSFPMIFYSVYDLIQTSKLLKKKISKLIICSFMFIFIFSAFSEYLFVNYYSKYRPTDFPNDYYQVIDLVKDVHTNILFVPHYSLSGYYSTWTNKRIGDFLQQSFNNTITANDFSTRYFYNFIEDSLADTAFLNIGFILNAVGIDTIAIDHTLHSGDTSPDQIKAPLNFIPHYESKNIDLYSTPNLTNLIRLSPISTFTTGGIDTLKHILNVGLSLNNDAIYFNQDFGKITPNINDYNQILLTGNSDFNDFLNRKYLIYPSDYISGGDPSKDNWVVGNYADDADQRLKDVGINANEKPMASRFVYTYHQGSFSIPIDVNDKKDYVVLIRHIPNKEGGKLEVNVGSIINNVDEYSSSNNQVEWSEIYRGKFNRKNIVIKSEYGFNIIDSFAVIPLDEYNSFKTDLSNSLKNKSVNYVYRAAYDFNNLVNTIDVSNDELTYSRSSSIFSSNTNTQLETFGKINSQLVNGTVITNFETNNIDLSAYDALQVNFASESPISYSVLFKDSSHVGNWPFLKQSLINEKLTYLFGDYKRSNVSNIQFLYKCEFDANCSYSVNNINLIRLNSEIEKNISFVKDGNYNLLTDIPYKDNESSGYVAELDGNKYKAQDINGKIAFVLNEILIGNHDFRFYAKEGSTIRTFYFQETDTNIMNSDSTPYIKKIDQNTDGTKYKVEFSSSSKDFDLILAKGFDTLWQLRDSNNELIKPREAFSLINGYHISSTTKSVTIEFLPQKYAQYGYLFSAITFLLLIIVCSYNLITCFVKK